MTKELEVFLLNEMRNAQAMAGRYQLNSPNRLQWNEKAELFRDAAEAIRRQAAADPFEHCEKEAEAWADLVEQMRGVYPGDPHNALRRDANRMRRLAKSIRQIRPVT